MPSGQELTQAEQIRLHALQLAVASEPQGNTSSRLLIANDYESYIVSGRGKDMNGSQMKLLSNEIESVFTQAQMTNPTYNKRLTSDILLVLDNLGIINALD
jgi:hypothetical protein